MGTGCARRWTRLRAATAAAGLATALAAALAPAAHGGVTPDLADAMARALPVDRLPVIATLAGQAETRRGDPPARILGELRGRAVRTQRGLLARLGLTGARGHWLVNAISLRASPLEIHLLAADRAVAGVDLDPPVALEEGPPPVGPLQAVPGNWGLEAVRAPQAWREVGATGASVRVGTIDTGVDARHPALAGKVVGWRDVIGARPAPYDDHGHGTHTAGIIVGGDATLSPLGVAPGAKLLAAKAIRGDGTGVGSDIIAAAEWLADPDGDPATPDQPGVISNSWGELSDANDPWFRPVLRRWRALGIVAVFAAGNSGPGAGSVGSPSGYPEALAVGAAGQDRRAADFSSRGPVAWENRDGLGPAPGPVPKPDLVAPGVNIVSSAPGGYRAYSGTSMASPHVAGVAALVRSANPALGGPEVERILRSSAADIGPPGRDATSGEGLVDALAATRAAAARRRPRARGGVRLTVAQLRINRRIAVGAATRVGRLEARLGTTAGPNPVTAAARAPIRRLTAAHMRLTQLISQSALRRATAVQVLVAGTPAGAAAPLAAPRGRVRLTVGQLLINQRIAQAALRRVAETERRAEASGMIPPG